MRKSDKAEMIGNKEISLLDYGGTIDKNVDWRVNESIDGICLNGFKLTAQDMADLTGRIIREGDKDFEFIVERIIQYQKWNFGKITPGAGQIGIYQVKDQEGKTWYALIKDYRAFEGDWRIMVELMTETEWEMKSVLMTDQLGYTFMNYLFPGR